MHEPAAAAAAAASHLSPFSDSQLSAASNASSGPVRVALTIMICPTRALHQHMRHASEYTSILVQLFRLGNLSLNPTWPNPTLQLDPLPSAQANAQRTPARNPPSIWSECRDTDLGHASIGTCTMLGTPNVRASVTHQNKPLPRSVHGQAELSSSVWTTMQASHDLGEDFATVI